MHALQVKRSSLRNSMPFFFEKPKPSWAEPELSIDRECPTINGLRCWQVRGPALAAMNELCIPIAQLLDKHCEALEQGEPKPRAVAFNMWMVGSSPHSAHPTIVFSSKSLRQRSFAKALLKESHLLDKYPGMKIKTLDKVPAVYQAEGVLLQNTLDHHHNEENAHFDTGVYLIDDSRGACGALITFGKTKRATMGAILLLDGLEYGISVQHARPDFPHDIIPLNECATPPCFDIDDDSDDESLGLVEITSKGNDHQLFHSRMRLTDRILKSESVTSDADSDLPALSSTSTWTRSESPSESWVHSAPSSPPDRYPEPVDHEKLLDIPRPDASSSGPQIATLDRDLVRTDLDYEVFQLNAKITNRTNDATSRRGADTPGHILPKTVATKPAQRTVWAMTGTIGPVEGMMTEQSHYIKMEGSQTFQEMWAVELSRATGKQQL